MLQSKIVFICPSKSWGGLEMNVFRLCLWLNKRGRNILLYCDPLYQLSVQAKLKGIETRKLEHTSKLTDIFLAKKLADSLKKENAQIVLFHLNSNFPLMSFTKLLGGNSFKLLYMQHMHLGGKKKDIFHRFIYNQLDCWIAPLQMFAKLLTKISSIKDSKIAVIPFGIELEKFVQCAYSQSEARKKLNLPIDRKIVGFIGRLDPRKCQHLLIEATFKLLQQGIEIDVLLVGDKSKNEEFKYAQELDDLIEKYDLKEHVHFRSHIDAVELAFKSLDIFCLTTASETFGMVTIEAMASGLAILGSNEGGTTEIIQHEKNGLLYQSGDSSEIASGIIRLLQDEELKEKLSKQARLDAQHNYSHNVQCDSLERCFDKYMKKSSSPHDSCL